MISPAKTIKLIDPLTNRILCNIRNPKLKIKGFNNDDVDLIDL